MAIRTCLSIAAISALLIGFPVLAESPNEAPVTTATSIHGAPGNTPGFGGNPANPNDPDNGQGIHNIAGGSPGIAGYNPSKDGKDPAGTMHGGLRETTGTESPLP